MLAAFFLYISHFYFAFFPFFVEYMSLTKKKKEMKKVYNIPTQTHTHSYIQSSSHKHRVDVEVIFSVLFIVRNSTPRGLYIFISYSQPVRRNH